MYDKESPVPDENVETETLNDADFTPSAEPTEAPDVNLDELLGTGIKYSELTDEEKAEAQEIYRIRDSVFADCESAGMDFEKSTVVGLIIQNASLTANEYMTILTKYPDEESAVEEIKEYGNFKYSVPRLKIESNPVCKELLISGKNAATILQGAVLYDILQYGDIAGYSELNTEQIEEMLSEEQVDEFESAMQILSPDIQQFGLDDGISLAAEDDGEYYNDVSRYPQAPFSYDKNGSEIFNESTGSLGYVLPGLSLDGSNGFGLNISAKYETSESSPYDITTSVFNTTAPTYSKQITPLNIAAGWSFEGISSIHVFDTSKYRNDYILKTADGTYTLSKFNIENKNRTEITINRSMYFKDMKLYKDTSYVNDDNIVSAYKLTYRDGRVEYFDEYGRLLMSQNRFGDQIKYSYWSSMNCEDQDLGQECSIIEINDTCGRKIIIERGEMQNNRQAITLSVYSGDDIIPGTTQIFNVRKIEVPVMSKDTTEYTTVLESYIDREGQKTEFEYIEDDVSSIRLYNSTWINQSFFALAKVKHPTGAYTEYTYAKSVRDYSNPQYLMLTKRCDVIGTSEENVITYSYDGKCFRNTGYTVTETNADGLCTEHRFVPCYEHTNTGFDNYGLSIQSSNSSGKFTLKGSDTTYYIDGETKKYVSKTEYESYFYRTYPTKTKNTIYDEEQNSIDIITNSEYNEYRDLVKSWDAYANGDTSNTEHMTEYTYDDTYHIITGKTYKKDANTTVREEYSLTSNSKAVASKKVYENDNLVSREDYAYADMNSANPSAATSYASDSKTIVTTTEYQNKSLPTKQTVDGVSVVYTYDALGRNISVTDGNGNTTRMTYDNLGRVITQTNVEGNTVTNTYPAANADGTISSNTLYVNTERGNDVKYTYDALGKILTVQDLDANLTTASYTYDDMGRVTHVYDGNRNRHVYSYDIQGRKIQYGVLEGGSTPSYVEVYQYDEVSDNETSCVKTIVGAGNDRVYKAEYTDKYGNKVKETAGDGSDISETTYTYNYIGEQVSSTTPNGDTYNISTTAQANSGKKAVTTDPLGHATTVIYDMLGREIETIDGNGNHAYKEYDSAGRVVSEKTIISGKDAIKKYKYDNNGNVLKESIKNNKAGEPTTYRNIYYKYDRMNRLISTNTDEEGETKYTYDEIGNILTMTTGVTDTESGVTTKYQYTNDARSLLVKLTDPMGYTETYTYDGNGNVLTKTDKTEQ